jgi:hypothetical protein
MTGRPQTRTIERRRVARQKSLLRGTIHFNNRRSALDCVIRDISPYGARLIFSDAVSVPDVFELNIPQKEQTIRSHVIWRHGHELGVAFAQHARMETAPDDGDLAGRVRRLEAEVGSLKRILRQLKTDAAHEFEAD